MSIIKRNFLLIVFIVSILVIQIPLIIPFFHTGFFPSHDDFQVVRMFEISQEIKYGNFPPRWSSGLLYGHGYPVFNFYGPFSYFVGATFIMMGFNYLVATKLVFIFYFLISALGIFLLIRNLMGMWPAIIGAIIFSFVPYRALDVYVRGTLGEFAAYSVFPLVFWMNLRLIRLSASVVRSALFGLFIAILITSHSISSFIYLSFLVAFNFFMVIITEKKQKRVFIQGLIKGFLLGIAASSFYWFPVIYEYKLIKLSEISFPYYRFFLTLPQIWQSNWGFEGFIEKNPMSLQLGQVLIITSIAAFVLNLFIKTKLRRLLFFIFAIFLLSIFIETDLSRIFWDKLSFLHLLQFPWRYHILITVLGSILTASFFYLLKNRFNFGIRKIIFYILAFLVIFLSIKESYSFFKPRFYSNTPPTSETTTWDDEYLPIWVKSKPKDYAADKIKITKGAGEVKDIKWGYTRKSFVIQAKTSSQIQIAQIYYPGWEALVNSKKVNITYNNDQGLMNIDIPSGESNVEFRFIHIWWRLGAEIISLLSLIYIIWQIIRKASFLRTKR